MKVEEVKDGDRERRVLLSMLFDPIVIARVAPKWTGRGLCRSPVANELGTWAVKHHAKFGKPIGVAVLNKLETWSQRKDEDSIRMMEMLLDGVRQESKKHAKENVDPEYLTHVAEEHFDAVRLGKACDGMKHALDSGDVAGAWEIHQACNRTGMSAGSMGEFASWSQGNTEVDPEAEYT